MVTRSPVAVVRKARRLSDPKPEFVSLVLAGANQVPFRTVKMDVLPSDEQENENMSQPRLKQDGHEIARFVFGPDKFDSEDAVNEWMASGGYADFTVTKSDGGFVIENKDVKFDGDLREIQTDEDVTVFVGKIKKAEKAPDPGERADAQGAGSKVDAVQPVARKTAGNPSEPVEPNKSANVVAFGEQLVIKFDSFSAFFSDGRTVAEVSQDATADGMPPALLEMTEMFYTAMRNNVLAGDVGALPALGEEFGRMLARLVELFGAGDQGEGETVQLSEDVRQIVADKIIPEVEMTTKTETKEVSKTEDGSETDATKATEEETKKVAENASAGADGTAEARTEDKDNGADSTTQAQKGEGEQDNATEVSGLSEVVAGLTQATKAITGLTEAVTAVKADSAKTAENTEKLAARVETLEGERQTRKSADAEGAEGSTETTKKSDDTSFVEERAFKGALGISVTPHEGGF